MPTPGPKVWITRTASGADRTAEAVSRAGFTPVISPLLVANPAFTPADIAPLLEDVAALSFTSVNGLAFADLTPRRDWPVFAVGDRTAEAARDKGFSDVVSASGDARDLAALIDRDWPVRFGADHPGVLLVPTAVQPAADLAVLLEGRVRVRRAVVYETLETPEPLPETFDIVLIHSPRAAQVLARRLPPGAAASRIAVTLSPACAEPLEALGFADLRVANRPDEASLLEALGKSVSAV